MLIQRFFQQILVVFIIAANTALVRAAVLPDTPFHRPYDEITDFLEDDPSAVATIREFGDTRDGRPIKAIIISDNPTVDEDEPVFVFTGVIHGKEVLGGRSVLKLVEALTEAYGVDPDLTAIVDAFEIWIIPVLNIYGYEHQDRKNANSTDDKCTSGVDLNRNGAFRWDRCDNTGNAECLDPMDDNFRGIFPNSEPESRSIRDLFEIIRPVFGITFHSGQGGPVGSVFYPYGTADLGEDNISDNCDDLIVSEPVDKEEGKAVARWLRDAIIASRMTGRLCDGTSEIVGACGDWIGHFGTLGSAGSSSAFHHANTGMFDFIIETNGDLDGDENFTTSEAWRDDYFYEENPTLNADEQKHFDDAVEYARNYTDGMLGLMDNFICAVDSTEFRYTGPGITGRTVNHSGNPVSAIVKVLELDTTLDADFQDLDCDGIADIPWGGPDLRYRRSERRHGRFFRLLANGVYTVEFSAVSLPTVTRTVTVDSTKDNCLLEIDVALQHPPVANAGPDQIVELQMPTGSNVNLDGSSSSDADSSSGNDDIVLFEWFINFNTTDETLIGSGQFPTVLLPLGEHEITLRVTDSWGEIDTDVVLITVQDTIPPALMCNSPAGITPPDAPMTYTASATDNCCEDIVPVITEFECFKFTKKGKRIDKKCHASVQNANFTIAQTGGVGTHIKWTIRAVDPSGNESMQDCELLVENPGKGKK